MKLIMLLACQLTGVMEHAALIFGAVHVKALGSSLLGGDLTETLSAHSFIPCSERIHVAVTEMAALFPKVC